MLERLPAVVVAEASAKGWALILAAGMVRVCQAAMCAGDREASESGLGSLKSEVLWVSRIALQRLQVAATVAGHSPQSRLLNRGLERRLLAHDRYCTLKPSKLAEFVCREVLAEACRFKLPFSAWLQSIDISHRGANLGTAFIV